MRDIVRTIRLCGLTLRGKTLKPVQEKTAWPRVKALVTSINVDSSDASVITRKLAKRAGAQIIPGLRTHRGRVYDGALMVLHMSGCQPTYHMVVVDDQLAATAGSRARMLLGRDYFEDNRALITDDGGLLVCPPLPLPPSKPTRRSKGSAAKKKSRQQGASK